MAIANYFLNYHELVLSRILSKETKLYPHQEEAILAIYQKASRGSMDSLYRQAALILAGVGTGKTLIQALTPYILAPWMAGEKALFLSDNCTLRSRFLRDFPTNSGGRPIYDQWLLYSLDILPPGVPPPVIVELDAGNFNSYAFAMQEADMLVGNRQFVVNLVNRGDIEPDRVGLLVVDEAHFTAAASYRTITNYFEKSLLTYFTGSKFRSDSVALPYVQYQEMDDWDELGNSMIRYAPIADFEFSLQQAWKLDPPPIKKLTFKEARSEAFLIEEDGEEVSYDLETFLNKVQTDRLWFRRILFADSFSLPVLAKAVEILLAKRKATRQPHAAIVRALNIPHTHRIAKLLEENFPVLEGKVGFIHSERDEYDLAGRPGDILKRFYEGEFWVLVHCGMVGVGFDHPWASVSCCLCVLKSLSRAEQEWGRIIRKVPGETPGHFPILSHPNWGVVVTHEALEIRPLLRNFLKVRKAIRSSMR
ncbi:MAG: DEAD/DEAH box helicase family protein, partial [Hydrococcus sp. CRU_1_1]|nr:DEAD/DEAH box helicase family protein [Hydrococcus sp. CRU_1_1]